MIRIVRCYAVDILFTLISLEGMRGVVTKLDSTYIYILCVSLLHFIPHSANTSIELTAYARTPRNDALFNIYIKLRYKVLPVFYQNKVQCCLRRVASLFKM